MTGRDIYKLIGPRVNKFLKIPTVKNEKNRENNREKNNFSVSPSPLSPDTTTSITTSISPITSEPCDMNGKITKSGKTEKHDNSNSIQPFEILNHSNNQDKTTNTKIITKISKINDVNDVNNNINQDKKRALNGLIPHTTEEAVCGIIPHTGFLLRLITGGFLAGDGCSRCPWLARCQGCVIPYDGTNVSTHTIQKYLLPFSFLSCHFYFHFYFRFLSLFFCLFILLIPIFIPKY